MEDAALELLPATPDAAKAARWVLHNQAYRNQPPLPCWYLVIDLQKRYMFRRGGQCRLRGYVVRR